VKLWDLKQLKEQGTLSGHKDTILSIAWSYDGKLIGSSSKDLMVRLWDPRSNTPLIGEAQGHSAPKLSRVAFLGDTNYFFSVGFNKSSHREFFVYDLKKFDKPILTQDVDQGSGIFEPYYDEDINVIMLFAMGDTSVRHYEFDTAGTPAIHHLTTNSLGTSPVNGIAKLPKTMVDVKNVEVAQFLKLSLDVVERISITVPRTRKDLFQDDIYCDTRSGVSALSAADWFAGKNAKPKLVSLRPQGMKKLSDEPKQERMVKKFNPDDVQMDADDLKEAVISRFYGQMMGFKEEDKQVLTQDAKQGADEDEWSD